MGAKLNLDYYSGKDFYSDGDVENDILEVKQMGKILILALFVVISLTSCKDKKELTWTAINVNSTGKQGDAHLISKNGRHFMIDTGQYYYVKRTLIPFLKRKHISYIDSILITHPHFDHYGGLVELMKSEIKIGRVYMNMPTKEQMEKV